MVPLGGTNNSQKTESNTTQPASVCGYPREPRYVLAGNKTTWYVDGDVVTQTVSVFQTPGAAVLLEESRQGASYCKARTEGDFTVDNHTEVKLPSYPGAADEYGWCDRATGKDKRVLMICHAQVTQKAGYVVVDMMVATNTVDHASALVIGAGSLAAERIAKLPSVP